MAERIDYLDDPAAPKANSVVPSANVIVVNDQGEILLIRRTDNGNWAVPGGGMDLGESITDTAVRETQEETGITCEITGLVGIYTNPRHVIRYTSNDEVRQEFSIVFTARPVGGELRPSSESSEPQWVSPAAVPSLQMHPSMRQRIQHYLDKRARALPRLSSEQLLNASGSGQDLRGSPLHKPCHLMIGTVPAADLHQPVSRPHIVTVRPGRHVAVEQRIGQQRVSGRELRRQLSAKTPDISLDLSARVVGNQAHNLPVNTEAAKIARPIQRVETRSPPVPGRTRCHGARPPPQDRQTATASWRPT